MASVGNDQALVCQVNQSQLRSDEHIHAGEFIKHLLVNTPEQLGRAASPIHGRSNESAQGCGEERRRNALSHYVGHDQQDALVGQRQHVIEVTTDLAGAQAKARKPKSWEVGKSLRQKGLLNISSYIQLTGQQPIIELFLLELRIDHLNAKFLGHGGENLFAKSQFVLRLEHWF